MQTRIIGSEEDEDVETLAGNKYHYQPGKYVKKIFSNEFMKVRRCHKRTDDVSTLEDKGESVVNRAIGCFAARGLFDKS
ncbi:unnamed protein product [Angiostrongylus costaricensis]|uniref:DNA-directed RNA polymerase n=1 Tax=Angiostrongylus costaricensis TaxID=334426 RepID=A0A0R3PNZ0_ANGCS|nr:unnamed protein product [Angiostrongylus costaricensis]